MAPDETIRLGGRSWYIPTDRSIANDLWIEAEAKRAGLTEIRIAEGEDAQAFASRLLAETVGAGRLFPLLGGLLFPVGTDPSDWTEQLGKESSRFLSRLTDRGDKHALRSIIAAVLARFFLSGIACAMTSETSSTKHGTHADLSSAAPIGEA